MQSHHKKPVALGMILVLAFVCGVFFAGRQKTYAIPAFARQLGVECTQCHTIWPRLNAFGRRFKVKGYVDQGPNPGFPLAARFMATAEIDQTTAPGGTTSSSSVIHFPSQVNVFVGKALTPEIGVFAAFTESPQTNSAGGTTWKASVDEQKYAWNFLKGKPVSLVAFHSTIFGFDPFPSLGNLAFEGDYSLAPGVMSSGELLSPFDTTGFGIVAHGFLDPKNRFYGAAGVETGGAIPDTLGLTVGTVDTSHGGLDYVLRFAYAEPVGDNGGSYNIGAAYYAGPQRPTIQLPTDGSLYTYSGNVNRLFLDGALELPVGEDNLFEVVGLYASGTDNHYFTPDAVSGVDGPFNTSVHGEFLQTSFYWNHDIGLRATYDTSTVDGLTTTSWQVGPVFLPLPTLKLNLNAGPTSDNQGNKTTKYQLILTKMF